MQLRRINTPPVPFGGRTTSHGADTHDGSFPGTTIYFVCATHEEEEKEGAKGEQSDLLETTHHGKHTKPQRRQRETEKENKKDKRQETKKETKKRDKRQKSLSNTAPSALQSRVAMGRQAPLPLAIENGGGSGRGTLHYAAFRQESTNKKRATGVVRGERRRPGGDQ